MIDNQIINEKKCFRCKLGWTKYNPLTFITDKLFCGNCALLVMRNMNQIWLEEALKRTDGNNT